MGDLSKLVEDMGGGCSIMPRVIRKHKGLSDSAKLMYLAIVDYSYNNTHCFPSQETLAEELGISVRWAKKQLQELREFGLIKVCQRAGSSNVYVLTPLGMVENLKREDVIPVPEEEQFIPEDKLEKLLKKNADFMEAQGAIVGRARKTKEQHWSARVDSYLKKLADGKELNEYDLCVAFALRYEQRYGKRYAVNWRADSDVIHAQLLSAGITGNEAIMVLETFVDMYDETFRSPDYPVPRIVQLKLDWIYQRVLKRAISELERQERERINAENEVVEVVQW